jgi:class 3 adenylate cyclase
VAELPSGTVTFLFTDIEGSTRLWQEHPETMKPALARHDEILRDAIRAHDGHYVKTTGDGAHAVFAMASDAIDAAVAAQVALDAEEWPLPAPLRVRMGVHSGPAEQRDGDYFGTTVNRAARIMSVAHGRQVVISLATQEVGRADGLETVDLGEHRLKDLGQPERIFQVVHPELAREFPPLRSLDTFTTNLPAQRTSFLGRERELEAIKDALAESRLVTLTGVGGVGKTRLAVQVAAELVGAFPDGVWLVELGTVAEPAAVPDVVAGTLGLVPQPGRSMTQSVGEALASRKTLLRSIPIRSVRRFSGTGSEDPATASRMAKPRSRLWIGGVSCVGFPFIERRSAVHRIPLHARPVRSRSWAPETT